MSEKVIAYPSSSGEGKLKNGKTKNNPEISKEKHQEPGTEYTKLLPWALPSGQSLSANTKTSAKVGIAAKAVTISDSEITDTASNVISIEILPQDIKPEIVSAPAMVPVLENDSKTDPDTEARSTEEPETEAPGELMEELERELIVSMMESAEKAAKEETQPVPAMPKVPEMKGATRSVVDSCEDLLSAAVVDSLAKKLPPVITTPDFNQTDPAAGDVPPRSPVVSKPEIHWEEPEKHFARLPASLELTDRILGLVTPKRMALLTSSLAVVISGAALFSADFNLLSLGSMTANPNLQIRSGQPASSTADIRNESWTGQLLDTPVSGSKVISPYQSREFALAESSNSFTQPGKVLRTGENAEQFVARLNLVSESESNSNPAVAAVSRYNRKNTTTVAAKPERKFAKPVAATRSFDPRQNAVIKTVRTKLLPITATNVRQAEETVSASLQAAAPTKVSTLSVLPSDAKKAGIDSGSALRGEKAVEVALETTIGISRLSSLKRSQLKSQLVRGECVAAALSQAFDRVPVVTMRDLVGKIDGDC